MIRLLVQWAIHQPRRVLGCIVVAAIIAAALASQLEVQSSRRALVAPDHPYQTRLLELQSAFGNPDELVFEVRGGTARERRGAVDALQDSLLTHPRFRAASVWGKLSIPDWAPLYVQNKPEAVLSSLRGLGLSPPVLRGALARGIPGLLEIVERQLTRNDVDAKLDPSAIASADVAVSLLEGVVQNATESELRETLWTGLLKNSQAQLGSESLFEVLDDAGYLQTSDKKALLVVVGGALSGDTADEIDAVVRDAREIQVQVSGTPDNPVRIALSGLPVLTVDEQSAIATGLWQSSLVTGMGIIVLLAVAFRALRRALVALVPLGLGALLSLGALQVLYGHVNAITSAFMAVLLGLGIDISVHLLARCDECANEGGLTMQEAVAAGIERAAPAVFVGCITTSLAFLMLSGAEFSAYGELGVITACGLMLMFLAAILVLPALLQFPRLSASLRSIQQGNKRGEPGKIVRFVQRLTRRSTWIVTFAALTAIAGVGQFDKLRFNARYFDFLPAHFESSQVLDRLEGDAYATPLMAFVRAKDLEDARNKTDALRKLPAIGHVQSPSDLLQPLSPTQKAALDSLRETWPEAAVDEQPGRESLATRVAPKIQSLVDTMDEAIFSLSQQRSEELDPVKQKLTQWRSRLSAVHALLRESSFDPMRLEWAQMEVGRLVTSVGAALDSSISPDSTRTIANLPELAQRRFGARNANEGVRIMVSPPPGFWEPGAAERFVRAVESVDPTAAGHGLSVYHHSEMIRTDFIRATLWAILAVLLVLLVTFRNALDTMLAVLPVVIGWSWMIGCLALLGLSFNAANIVVLPLVLGIGVDAGVHMVHRARSSAQRLGRTRGDLAEVIGGTGVAVTISAMTTMIGFGGLMVADYGGMTSLGFAMVLGVGLTWVATVLVLPACLRLLGRV